MAAKHVFVLVVHDPGEDVTWVTEGLRNDYIIHVANDGKQLDEALSARRYASVVCCLGATVRARDYGIRITRTAPDQRVIFAAGPNTTDDDFAYMRGARSDWLPYPTAPQEVLALVRAVAG